MVKPDSHLSELVHNTKHPFRQVENRPEKPLKHRYERRKIREIMRINEWEDDTPPLNEIISFRKMDLTCKLKSENQVCSMRVIMHLRRLFVEMIMSTGFKFTDQNCKPKP